jgi:uncharacterized protein (TIGR02301 family)
MTRRAAWPVATSALVALFALLAHVALFAHGALAQPLPQRPRTAPAAPAQPPPAPELPPAYEGDMLKLAEVMGSLAFLSELCGASAEPWRERMARLIEAEGPSPARRDRLAGAYNAGFRGFALTYRLCTDNAREAMARLGSDGDRLARALAARFGG